MDEPVFSPNDIVGAKFPRLRLATNNLELISQLIANGERHEWIPRAVARAMAGTFQRQEWIDMARGPAFDVDVPPETSNHTRGQRQKQE